MQKRLQQQLHTLVEHVKSAGTPNLIGWAAIALGIVIAVWALFSLFLS